MHKNLYFYTQSRKIQYDTDEGPVTIDLNGLNNNAGEMLTSFDINVSEVVKTYDLIAVLGILEIEEQKYFMFVQEGDILADGPYKVYSCRKLKYILLSENKFNTSSLVEIDAVVNFIETHPFYVTNKNIKEFYIWNKSMKRNYMSNLKSETNIKIPQTDCNRSLFMFSKTKQVVQETKHNLSLLFNLFCGFFESQTYRNGADNYLLEMRSFISTNKIGPRMLCRGVDLEGNVSFL